jgi:DNA-binding transcriptional MocR family regulator
MQKEEIVTITVGNFSNCTPLYYIQLYSTLEMSNGQQPRPPKAFLYEQVAADLTELIQQGTFRPGERLPSVRQMSQQRKISITTILQAYMLLEDRGLIEARPQSGYYVRLRQPESLPELEMTSPSPDPSQVSLQEVIMMVLRDAMNPKLVQLGAALPNIGLMPIEKLNRITASLARQADKDGYQYMFPPGLEALRIQIAQRAVLAGCTLSPNEIIITAGGMEAIDLCLHAVCRPGDLVAIESPMYFGTLQSLEVHGLKVIEIPTHPREGISLEALQLALEHNPVRAVLAISNFNNPLGSCVPDEKKKALVELLTRYDVPLIDNDVSGEIYFTKKRPLVTKAFDKKGLVMLCSSFSKDISPALRVGWVVPGRFRAQVEWLKFTNNLATPTLSQKVVARFLESGGYDHHLRRIRREYARNIAQQVEAVTRHLPSGARVTHPTGGFVLWAQLPERVDSLQVYKQALNAGITITPGYLFSATNQYKNFIRLNAASWSEEIEWAVKRLGEIIAEQKTG